MTLKTKYFPYLIGYLALLYIGFVFVNGFNANYSKVLEIGPNGFRFNGNSFAIIFHFGALVLSYVIPSDWKNRLIYFRWHDPLPGCRIFTELCLKDKRISRSALSMQYGDLPTSATEQNALWYEIYKSKQSDKVVSHSQDRWLLFRDLYSISIILIIPLTILTYYFSGSNKGLLFSGAFLALIILFDICARNAGNRFACNVLAR